MVHGTGVLYACFFESGVSPVGIFVEVMFRCSPLCIWMWIHAAGSEGKFLYPVWTKFKPVLMGCEGFIFIIPQNIELRQNLYNEPPWYYFTRVKEKEIPSAFKISWFAFNIIPWRVSVKPLLQLLYAVCRYLTFVYWVLMRGITIPIFSARSTCQLWFWQADLVSARKVGKNKNATWTTLNSKYRTDAVGEFWILNWSLGSTFTFYAVLVS